MMTFHPQRWSDRPAVGEGAGDAEGEEWGEKVNSEK
jgi:hypothetical protein